MSVRQWVIEGRVQGVGFRAWTRHTAQRLGLRGWVRNLPDGRVEVAAAGEDDVLQRFATLLAEGPSHARVTACDEVSAAEAAREDAADGGDAGSRDAGIPAEGFLVRY